MYIEGTFAVQECFTLLRNVIVVFAVVVGVSRVIRVSAMALWKWMFPDGKKPQDCPFCVLAAGAPQGRTPSVLFQVDPLCDALPSLR